MLKERGKGEARTWNENGKVILHLQAASAKTEKVWSLEGGFLTPFSNVTVLIRRKFEVLSLADSPYGLFMNFLRNINTSKQKPSPSLPLWSLASEIRNVAGLPLSHTLPESLLPQKNTNAVTSTHLGNIPSLNNAG